MENNLKTLYSLNDITVIPEKLTDIDHRKECDPLHNNLNGWNILPIFVSPMSCVVNEYNWKKFDEYGLQTIIPRNVDLEKRYQLCERTFSAFGLEEFRDFIKYNIDNFENALVKPKYYVCIDIANGHMKSLYELCQEAKKIYGEHICIMAGNIANPETYLEIARYKCIDFIRIGIGSGNVCTTSANTAIHYPMASLIMECKKIKDNAWQLPDWKFPDIVADGGFKNFDQIIKALALGADYCMLGQIFAKSDAACGKIHYKLSWKGLLKGKPFKKFREYYGMSTRKAQKEFGGEGKKTAEGIFKLVEIEYSLKGWINNFIDYLRSAMSYTNCKTLEEFIGGPRIGLMTGSAYTSYFK